MRTSRSLSSINCGLLVASFSVLFDKLEEPLNIVLLGEGSIAVTVIYFVTSI